jgi:hypothetical protein
LKNCCDSENESSRRAKVEPQQQEDLKAKVKKFGWKLLVKGYGLVLSLTAKKETMPLTLRMKQRSERSVRRRARAAPLAASATNQLKV